MKFGIIEIAGPDLPESVTFEVGISHEEGSDILFAQTLEPRDEGKISQFQYKDCDLGEYEDRPCTLSFRCRLEGKALAGNVRCGWGNLKIDSSGKRDLLKRIGFTRSDTAYDLIELLEGKISTEKTVWARTDDGRKYEADLPWGIDLQFTPFFDESFPEMHKQAAIVFGEGHTIRIPDLKIPDAETVSLVFSTGLGVASSAAGGATFTVSVEGDRVQSRELFRESITGGHATDMWRNHGIDLSEYAGSTVTLLLGIAYAPMAPQEVILSRTHPLAAGQAGMRLHVERPLAAFGHPRVMWGETIGRRFSSKKKARNLILINIDSLSKSYLGCYGAPYGLTPCLDRMAEVGLLFKDFCASSSQALPSVASLLTGLYPSDHGAGVKRREYLPHSRLCFAELVQKHSGSTAAFVAGHGLSRHARLEQGFETFVYMPGQNARTVNALFNDWLISNADFRFFAYLHYSDPHAPFNAPAGLENRYVPSHLRERQAIQGRGESSAADETSPTFQMTPEEQVEYLRGRYFGEIEYLDRRIQDLLSLLGDYNLLKETVIVITAGYGQAFMEHGAMGHGTDLFNESLLVPLIICGPEAVIGPHQVVEGMADHASLFATCTRLMGFDPLEIEPLGVQRSLFPVEERSSDDESFAWSELFGTGEGDAAIDKHLCSLMSWRYKLITDGALHKLFNLVEDPLERNDIAGSQPAVQKELLDRVEEILSQRDPQAGAR